MWHLGTGQCEPPSQARPPLLSRAVPAIILFLLISFAYNWNYLKGRFQLDEYLFLCMMQQDPPPYSHLLGLWSTHDVPALTNVWWLEGGGSMRGFWRPLPSLMIEGSIYLFGERAFPLHVVSIVVHGLVAGTLFLLVRRLTGQPLIALLASVFFLSCEDHSMGVGWISTVTDLICVLFINLSLLGHAIWLDTRKPWALIASLAALVLAFLSKESAVVAPVLIVLMTWLMPRGRCVELSHTSLSSLRVSVTGLLQNWASWLPAIVLLAVYLVIYRLLGFGGLNSGIYIDPLAHPGRYMARLAEHLPIMWLATLSPVPPSLPMFVPELESLAALVGAIVFIVWVLGLWSMRRNGVLIWAVAVYILALLPQMATGASERGLYLPTIGSSIALAMLLVQIGPIARRMGREVVRPPVMTRAVGWGVTVFVLVPGIVLSATYPYMYVPSLERPYEDTATAFAVIEERDPEQVLLLNTPGFFQTLYPPVIIEHHARRRIDVRVLSSLNGVVSVERVDDRSFVIRADRKGWLTNFFAEVLRSPKPLKLGKVYDKGVIKATLRELTSDRRDVLAVRFDLDRPLDDPGLLVLQWDGRTFRAIDVATLPVGEVFTLADTSDIWASMR